MTLPDWDNFSPTETAVISFALRGNEVLLIHKKRGLGAGKINGPGGRLEDRESPLEAAVRETREEVGLNLHNLRERATLRFAFTDGYNLKVHVFLTNDFDGSLVETDEADPFWVDRREIPYDRMWADDATWLPLVLQERSVDGWFVFEDDGMLWSRVESRLSADS